MSVNPYAPSEGLGGMNFFGFSFIFGEESRQAFTYQYIYTTVELEEMLERNAYMDLACNRMVTAALKNGFTFLSNNDEQQEYLEDIHGNEKNHDGAMWSRLEGEAVGIFYDEDEAPTTEEKKKAFAEPVEEDRTFETFEVYPRYGKGGGWLIGATDGFGNPRQFHIFIINEKKQLNSENASPIEEKDQKEEIVNDFWVDASRCVVFKNPKKSMRWGGTPTSKLICAEANCLSIILKAATLRAVKQAGGTLQVKRPDGSNAPLSDEEQAAFQLAYAHGTVDIIFTNAQLEPIHYDLGTGDISELATIVKEYISCALGISKKLIDGDSQGDISSAAYDALFSYDAIQSIQTNFKPYFESVFEKLGFAKDFEWNLPQPAVQEQNQNENVDGTSGDESESDNNTEVASQESDSNLKDSKVEQPQEKKKHFWQRGK